MIIITVESSISNISLPDIGISFTDKIIHFGLFGILGWLLARGFYSFPAINEPYPWLLLPQLHDLGRGGWLAQLDDHCVQVHYCGRHLYCKGLDVDARDNGLDIWSVMGRYL